MKLTTLILSVGLAGGLLTTSAFADDAAPTNNAPAPADATNAVSDASQTPTPADAPPPADTNAPPPAVTPPDNSQQTSVTDTNTIIDPATGELKLRMKFHNAPIETVLDYMSAAAGYIIHPTVSLSGKVTVWSDQPLNKDEAINLVKQVLYENGYTGILGEDKRTLTIMSSASAKHGQIPVKSGNTPASIPINTEIVTQIIPVRSLNAVSLKQDLQPLLPPDTTITANESGNALVVTDTQANIHRIAEIVRALDSVSSSSATIIVFPLKYADAKNTAALIKDLFPPPSAAGGSGGDRGFFGRFRGFGGGGDSGGGGSTTDTGAGHTPTSRVTAVSDDHANALVVSAPDDLVPTIKELVASLDTDVEDTTVVKIFTLKNADAIETATLLSNLFPDESKSQDNNNSFSSRRFGLGFFGGPPQSQSSSSANSSDRVKQMNRVTAVPDARTGSLVVSASKDLMPQIITIVDKLDESNRRKLGVHVVDLSYAEPQDVLTVLQDLFPSSNNSKNSQSATSAQNAALTTRNTTLQQQQNANTSTIGSTSGSSLGRGVGN